MRALIVALALAAVPATASAQMHDGHDPAGGASVEVQFAAFGPANVDVLAGDEITWMNVSVRRHDVAATDGSFDSGSLFPGARRCVTSHAAESRSAYKRNGTSPALPFRVVIGMHRPGYATSACGPND